MSCHFHLHSHQHYTLPHTSAASLDQLRQNYWIREKIILTSPLLHLSKTESINILQTKSLYTTFLLFLWKNMKGWWDRSTLYRVCRRFYVQMNHISNSFCISVPKMNLILVDWKSWSRLFVLGVKHSIKKKPPGNPRKQPYTQKAQPWSDASVKRWNTANRNSSASTYSGPFYITDIFYLFFKFLFSAYILHCDSQMWKKSSDMTNFKQTMQN